MIFVPFIIVLLALVAYFLYRKYSLVFRRKNYQKTCQKLYPEWKQLLSESFKPFTQLESKNTENLLNLLQKMSVLYCEKKWSNELSENEKVLICARGAYPLLNRETNYYAAITFISSDDNGVLWYQELKKQFESDYGAIVDRTFSENFSQVCREFLYEDKLSVELKDADFKRLKSFFKLETN